MVSVALYFVPLPVGGVNCTAIVQVCRCVSDAVGHVLVPSMVNSAAPVPVIVGAGLKVNVTVPSLVIVNVSVFVDGFATVPKASDPVIFTSVPVPVTGNGSDVAESAVSVKFAVTVPGITPIEVGVKATLKVHVALVAIVVTVLQPPVVMPV
jgi:hypothetical protein